MVTTGLPPFRCHPLVVVSIGERQPPDLHGCTALLTEVRRGDHPPHKGKTPTTPTLNAFVLVAAMRPAPPRPLAPWGGPW
jgi:hypothetical protein